MNYHKLAKYAWVATGASLLLLCVGCAGTAAWISDALQIVPLAASTIASILTLIAGLQGKSVSADDLTKISTFSTATEAGLKDLETMVEQYKATPTTDIQSKILDAANVIVANIQQFLADTKLGNQALQQKVVAIVSLVQSQLQAWIELIPALTATPGTRISFSVPYSAKEFKESVNTAMSRQTGDADVDEAAAKVKRL